MNQFVALLFIVAISCANTWATFKYGLGIDVINWSAFLFHGVIVGGLISHLLSTVLKQEK